MKNINKIIILLFFVFYTNNVKADLSNDMNKFFNNLGGSTNSNSAYVNQSAGYYTGGSFNARVPVVQQRPFNAQPPKITAGCGGIDMFTGSFSHINLDPFVAQMKAIGSNAVGYAFQIGLETLSPVIASTISKLQEIIDQINSININSCESAKLLVDGISGRNITAKESMCAQMALISGSASDADAAKSRCKSPASQVAENNKLNDEQKFTDINFTWQALKKDGYITSLGEETAEAFMSMVGTVINKNNADPDFIAPIVFDENYTKALINGGNIKIKKCDEINKCLNLTDKEITISEDVAYKTKIKSLLQSMQDKIRDSENSNNTLTDSEKALIGQTSIPILRIMINNAIEQGSVNNDLLAEIVSRRILNQFFDNISSTIRQQLTSLQFKNNNKETINILSKNIDLINEYLDKDRKKISEEFNQLQQIIEMNQKIDAELASQFSGRIKSVLDFGNQLSNGGK